MSMLGLPLPKGVWADGLGVIAPGFLLGAKLGVGRPNATGKSLLPNVMAGIPDLDRRQRLALLHGTRSG